MDAQPRASTLRTIFEVSATSILVMAALAMVWANRSRILPAQTKPSLAVPARPIDIAGASNRGATTAKIAIVEFTEFQCPFCGIAAREILTQVDNDYISQGHVLLVQKNFPIAAHPLAPAAARAALCAGAQGKYWQMHDLLFRNQDRLAEPNLAAFAAQARLDLAAFDSCRESRETQRLVDADTDQGTSLGVTGTPSFFFGTIQNDGRVKVSDVLVGAKPYAEFKAILDRLLKKTSS